MKTPALKFEAVSEPEPLRERTAVAQGGRFWLAGIILLALGIRAMFLLRGGSQWIFNDDSDYYLELARGFLHGCGFAPFSGYCGPAEILRTPGYPLFLIPFFSHYRLVVLVQALLGALTCLVVANFAAKKRGLLAGLIAAGFLAFDIPTILATKEIMSEPLFQCVALIAVFACFQGWGIVSAAVVGLAIFIRPVGLVLIPVAALALVLQRNWTAALIVMAVCGLLVVGWAERNQRRAGVFSFTVEGTANLFWFTAPGVIARHDRIPAALARESLNRALEAKLKLVKTYKPSLIWGPADTPAGSRLMRSQAITVLRSYPVDAAIITLQGFANVAFEPYTLETGWHGFIRSKGLFEKIRLLSTTTQRALLLLLWCGALLALFDEPLNQERWLIFSSALLILLAASPFPGNLNARFRTPAIPFLAVLAGIGWAATVSRLRTVACPASSFRS